MYVKQYTVLSGTSKCQLQLISEGGTLLTNFIITYSTIAACCQFNRFGCLLITLNIENIKNTKDTCIHILSIEIYIKFTLCCFSYFPITDTNNQYQELNPQLFFSFLYCNIGKYRNLSPNTGKYRKW